MPTHLPQFKPRATPTWLLAGCVAAVLSACGGGDATSPDAPQLAAQVATGTTVLQLTPESTQNVLAQQSARPSFHLAPVLLDAPDDSDAHGANLTAHRAARTQAVPAEFLSMSTRGLSLHNLQAAEQIRAARLQARSVNGVVTPMAAGAAVSTYSPAQIRAAYGLPALPASLTGLTAVQAAQLGAGQTIYIVDAMHDPSVAAELAAFNQKFGLPACTTKLIAPTATLPLAAPSSTACEFSVVYNTAAATMTATAPAYDSGWATEIALDVQWAHATAPLARIVLIEAPDASLNSLLGGVKLANAMGPGVVSMSFGASEGNWTASVDSAFTGAGMTYLAATGDNGAAVEWPSVSPNVVAVGGTSLTYSGSGARSEVSWSGTGGGVSAYTPTPSYQTSAVPGMGTVARRSVADVAFNADPSTGQYVAVLAPGASTASWVSAGGTSLSTPQWAGIVAIANATRAQVAKPKLGAPHSVLYGQIATVPSTYAASFADVKAGSDGTCATCTAKTGYDPLSGLGTPNVSDLLNALAGSTVAAAPPVVTSATINGMVGTALSFTVSATAPNPLTYSLSGAPAGMSISSTGAVTWSTPVQGSYAVTVTAKDSKTGLSGSGVYTVVIAPIPAPVVTPASISGKVGTALSFTVSVTAPNAVTYSLTGAPAGMGISTTGVVSWATPLAGTYAVTVTAKDSKTGLSGSGVYTVTIAAQPAPIVTGATINGKPGTALSFTVAVNAPNPVTYSMTGAPAGMAISSTGVVSWTSPVLGNYTVTVSAKDSKTGLSGSGVFTVKIANAGPTITAAPMVGVAGKSVSTVISIADPGATSISISISGAPMGMTFSVSGLNITATWPSPVTGSYTLQVSVSDNAGLSAKASIPITITAK